MRDSSCELSIPAAAAVTRLGVWAISVLVRSTVNPYDTSASIQTDNDLYERLRYDSFVHRVFGGSAHWDGVYFLHLAEHGYPYEHSHAFFPLMPLLMRLISHLFYPLHGVLSYKSMLLISGWLISNVSFVLAAVYLHKLGKLLLASAWLAKLSALIFCLTPAGVFMSALYTESLCCLLCFAGMYYLELHTKHLASSSLHLFVSVLCFSLASLARSNGNLMLLYLFVSRVRTSPPIRNFLPFVLHWTTSALLALSVVLLQVAYFIYGIIVYCPSYRLIAQQIITPWIVDLNPLLYTSQFNESTDRPWCASVVPNVASMYQFIQKEYWNVGFLKYYELRQIPNFILASPMIVLSTVGVFLYVRHRVTTWNATSPFCTLDTYFFQWGIMLFIGTFISHVQIITRFLSSCPAMYWFAASCVVETSATSVVHSLTRHVKPKLSGGEVVLRKKSSSVILGYCILYTVLGSVLFSAYLPWT